MQKYIKNDLSEIRYFDDDVIISEWIDLTEYRLMTDGEIDRHENPEKFWSEEQKEAERLKQFAPLTRRQFKIALLNNNLLDVVESKIDQIEDPKLKTRIQIEYNEADKFERTSDSVNYMINMLELTPDQVGEMWLHAMSL